MMINTNNWFTNTTDLNMYKKHLPDIILAISQTKVKRHSDGKISSEQTLKNIEDSSLKEIIRFLFDAPRSKILPCPAKEVTRYCSLVPLAMSAFKEYHNIGYDEWDKTDVYLKYMMGKTLYNNLIPYAKSTLTTTPTEMRYLATHFKDSILPKDVWQRHIIKLSDGKKIAANNLARYIHSQTWMANVVHRNKYMILDIKDWDIIPEPLDAVLDEWDQEQGYVQHVFGGNVKEEEIEEELPF